MTQDQTKLALHKARLVDLWERMVRTMGIHTVNVLMERAIWGASEKHPELALIEHDDEGLSFDAMDLNSTAISEQQMDAAFNDLTAELLMILARLLGKEMAQNIARELESRMAGGKGDSGSEEAGK